MVGMIGRRRVCVRELGLVIKYVNNVGFSLMQDECNEFFDVSQCVCCIAIGRIDAVDLLIVQLAE